MAAFWGAHCCLFPHPGAHPGEAGAAHLAGGCGERRALPPHDHFPPRCSCKNPMKLGLLQQGGLEGGRREGGELPACPALPVLSKDAAEKLLFNHLPPFFKASEHSPALPVKTELPLPPV